MPMQKHGNRKKHATKKTGAISPAIATVILVAITLVAGVSIGGFVFGLFGTQTTTAQVTSSSASMGAGAVTGTAGTMTAACASGVNEVMSLTLRNTGAANTQAVEISLTYGGTTYTATLSCGITAGSTATAWVSRPAASTAGQTYVGEVVLSNGARVPFTGTFR